MKEEESSQSISTWEKVLHDVVGLSSISRPITSNRRISSTYGTFDRVTILSTPYFIRDFHRVRNAKFPFTNEGSVLVLSFVYSFIRREIPFEISLPAAFAILSRREGDDCTSILVCSRSIEQPAAPSGKISSHVFDNLAQGFG